jgi:hypothetical protein
VCRTARHRLILLVVAATLAIPACGLDSSGISVTPEVKISITPTDLVLTPGLSARLEATVHDAEGQLLPGNDVQWSSTAPEIVAVSSHGLVTARSVGRASIVARSGHSIGTARVVVQLEFRIPVSSSSPWLVVTEAGTPAVECTGGEGGLRMDGRRDCTHSGVSRYSLDLADAGQWTGVTPGAPAREVVAAADGTITDICLEPPTQVTCGPKGPFVLVEHPGGFTTLYAHLEPSSVTLRRKTPVRRGEPLGVMGGWGTEPAPWVHFELRYDNQGAAAASVLDNLQVSGLPIRGYRAGEGVEGSLRSP